MDAAQPGDTADNILLDSEVLKGISPVLKGFLSPDVTGSETEPTITVGCTEDELYAFGGIISMLNGDAQASFAGLSYDARKSFVWQGLRAMRLIQKYDAGGILRMLDLAAECLMADSLLSTSYHANPFRIASHTAFEQTLTDYVRARLETFPEDTPANALSETTYSFLLKRITAKLVPAAQETCKHQVSFSYVETGHTLRYCLEDTIGAFPKKISVEIIMRIIDATRSEVQKFKSEEEVEEAEAEEESEEAADSQ